MLFPVLNVPRGNVSAPLGEISNTTTVKGTSACPSSEKIALVSILVLKTLAAKEVS